MEAVKCRRPGDTRGMCLGSSQIRGAAAGYVGLQLRRCRGAGGLPSVVMGKRGCPGKMVTGRARRSQPGSVLSYIITYPRVFLPEEKDRK